MSRGVTEPSGRSLGRRLKHGLKVGLKRGLGSFGSAAGSADTRILTYHSVGYRDHEMNVRPEMFTEQMAWLEGHFPIIDVVQAAAGEPGIAITFDDGYRDNLVHAAPVLERHRAPSTVFLVTGKMGGFLDHDPEGDEDSRLLTWEEACQLAAAGMEAGAHSRTHPRLARLPVEEQRAEIAGSMSDILEMLGVSPRVFAYPFGTMHDFDESSMKLVRDSGARAAVSNRFGPLAESPERWALRRIWIDASDDMDLFRAKVTGRLDLLRVLDSRVCTYLRRCLNRFLRT